MDPPTQCQISILEGAGKICISQQCKLSNCFICPACEQSHQHNGSILAVRIGKVKQIKQKITKTKKRIQQVTTHMLHIKQQVNNKINRFIGKLGTNNNIINELHLQLEQYFSYNKKQGFSSTWNKVKQNICMFDEKESEKRNLQVMEFQKQLLSILKPIQQDIMVQTNINKQKQGSHQSNLFLNKFSNIFSYIGLTMKSKPQPNQLQQIKLLQPSNRSQRNICAKLYQLSQQPQTALQIYNNILKQSSLDIQTINRKALLLKRMKKYQQAYEQFTLLIDLVKQRTNPQYYHYHRGEICRQLGKYQQALSQYSECRAKQTIPQYKLDHAMALVYFKQAKHKEAIQLFKKLVKNQALSVQDKNQIHQCLVQCGKLTSNSALQLQSLNVLRKSKPENIQILFKRAKVHHQMKDHKAAIKDYNEAIDRADNIPGLYFNRALQMIQSGDKEQALPDLKKAIELDPTFKQAVHLLANTSFQLLQGNHNPQVTQHLKALAINSYGYSLKFYPNNEGIWHNLAILQSQKDSQKAYDYFSKAVSINPRLAASYLGKIKAAILLKKDPKDTIRDIETLINIGDRSVATFSIKSVLEQQMGMYKQALQTANLVLKADPENQTMNESKKRLTAILEQKQKLQKKQEQNK